MASIDSTGVRPGPPESSGVVESIVEAAGTAGRGVATLRWPTLRRQSLPIRGIPTAIEPSSSPQHPPETGAGTGSSQPR